MVLYFDFSHQNKMVKFVDESCEKLNFILFSMVNKFFKIRFIFVEYENADFRCIAARRTRLQRSLRSRRGSRAASGASSTTGTCTCWGGTPPRGREELWVPAVGMRTKPAGEARRREVAADCEYVLWV